jgi:peroxiredoxin
MEDSAMSKRTTSPRGSGKAGGKLHSHQTRALNRRRKKPSWLPYLAAAAVVLVGVLWVTKAPPFSSNASTAQAVGAPIGQSMTNMTGAFPSSSGGNVSLSQYHGKKLVVYFYEGISCGPCQQQLQMLQKNIGTIHRDGADVVAVTVDPMNVSQSAARQMKLGFPILDDVNHQMGSAFRDFHLATAGMDMGPVDNHAMFVLDQNGVVRWKSMAAGTMNVSMSELLNAVRHTS